MSRPAGATAPTRPARRARGGDEVNTRHMTVAEFCEELGIARSTFNDWRAKRKAPCCIRLPNRMLLIRRTDFDTWLSAHEEPVV